jgi:hypothetical protein
VAYFDGNSSGLEKGLGMGGIVALYCQNSNARLPGVQCVLSFACFN